MEHTRRTGAAVSGHPSRIQPKIGAYHYMRGFAQAGLALSQHLQRGCSPSSACGLPQGKLPVSRGRPASKFVPRPRPKGVLRPHPLEHASVRGSRRQLRPAGAIGKKEISLHVGACPQLWAGGFNPGRTGTPRQRRASPWPQKADPASWPGGHYAVANPGWTSPKVTAKRSEAGCPGRQTGRTSMSGRKNGSSGPGHSSENGFISLKYLVMTKPAAPVPQITKVSSLVRPLVWASTD